MLPVSLMNMNPSELNKIVDFAIRFAPYYSKLDRKDLIRAARDHLNYKTLLVLRDKEGIYALARWNVLPNRTVLHIIDLIIRPDRRSLVMLRQVALAIWKMNPQGIGFYYERMKHAKRGSWGYGVKHWFKLIDSITRKGESQWVEKGLR